VIEQSDDDGATWQVLDVQPQVLVYKLGTAGAELYAGRRDGLWRRSAATTSVPGRGASGGLHFALMGPQPVANVVRFHFELSEAGEASIEFFDIACRRAADTARQSWSAGAHELSWSTGSLSVGIYEARLTAGAQRAAGRLICVR
jgi:hypothetical protein